MDEDTQTDPQTADSTPLDTLSFSEATPEALEVWLANLPLVNVSQSADQLLMGCREITRLRIEPAARYALIDTVRPLVHYVSSRMLRTNDRELHKAHDIIVALSNAFARNFGEAQMAGFDSKDQRQLIAKCAHALLAERSRVLLYTLQSYSSLPQNFWAELHHAYLVAENLELDDFSQVEGDADSPVMTIKAVYLRALLLHCARPAQLSSSDLENAFQALVTWTDFIEFSDAIDDAMFIVDLQSNRPPILSGQGSPTGPALRALRTEVLTFEMDAYVNEVSSTLEVPERVKPPLMNVLARAWSQVIPRGFKRRKSDDSIRICVGLRAVHYFLAGGVEFNEQLHDLDAPLRREVNPFLDLDYEPVNQGDDPDPWSQAHDLKVRIPENPNIVDAEALLDVSGAQHPQRKYDHHEVVAVDTSPEGYRLSWDEEHPAAVQVGEIVGLRAEHDSRWTVGAIRWIAAGDDGNIQMGVQLLAPRAIPIALRQIQTRGGQSGYARGLLLPAIEAIGQPTSMITPRVPFSTQQKVHVQRQGIQATGLLMDRLQNTQNFNQFTFRVLDGYLENSGQGRNMDVLSAMTREDTTQDP